MSKNYKYSGLTPELYQRLVSEHEALRKAHKKGSYKQFFQEVKQCDELQARIIYQAFNSAVVERAKISPKTVDRLEGIISDELFDDLQDYLSINYTTIIPKRIEQCYCRKLMRKQLSEVASENFENIHDGERLHTMALSRK